MNWKTKIEKKFENLSDFIFDNRIKVIFFVLFIMIAMASQLKNLTVDTSTEGFLHENDVLRIQYDKYKEQFGNDDKILLAIQTKNVFNLEFLKKLKTLHNELKNNVPYLDDINSLVNARNTKGTKESLIVDDLFKTLPKDKQELALKKQLVDNNPLLKDLVIDKDGTITTIIIDLNTYTSLDKNGKDIVQNDEISADEFSDEPLVSQEKKEFLSDLESIKAIKKVNEIVKNYNSDDFSILVSGSAVVAGELKASMKRDMQKFIKLVLLTMAIILFIMFRRVSGIFLPLLTVILTIVSTLSLMGIFQAPITVVTQILPSFLLAVMIGASIHLLAVFYDEYDKTHDKKSALRHAMGHSAFAIVMTSLTTAAGLWSFSFSAIAPVADLGNFASMGVIVGLLYTLVLLPALLSILKIKPKTLKNDNNKLNKMDKVLLYISSISINYPKRIIVISSIIIFISLMLASNLRFSHNPVQWFDIDNPIRVATKIFDDKLKGSSAFEIVIDTKTENGLYNPKILNEIDTFAAHLMALKNDKYYVGKTVTITDVLKETNKALHANDEKFYTIPQNKDLIAQELFLFSNSGSDDLEDFVNSSFSKASMTVKVPYLDAIDYISLLKEIKVLIKQDFSSDTTVYVTGISALLAKIMSASMSSSAISYVLALVLITIMMLILVGHIKIGLISMIPNISPILVMTTIMVIFDMPLDMFTMLIGAIAIGLAVDDTVHFMHNFRKYELEFNDVDVAIQKTFLGTGRAMIVTSIVLVLGFFVFMGASMSNIFNFGLLTGIAIVVALAADFFLVPALMKVIVHNKKDLE